MVLKYNDSCYVLRFSPNGSCPISSYEFQKRKWVNSRLVDAIWDGTFLSFFSKVSWMYLKILGLFGETIVYVYGDVKSQNVFCEGKESKM